MSETPSTGVRRCRTCNEDILIPANAVPVLEKHGLAMYVIAGQTHSFSNRQKGSAKPEIEAAAIIEPILPVEIAVENRIEPVEVMPPRQYKGFIKGFNSDKGYFFLVNEHDREFFAHLDDCIFENNHVCSFKVVRHVPVLFEKFQFKKGGKHNRAVNVRRAKPMEFPEYETSIVIGWNGNVGHAKRHPCGCEIAFGRRNIISVFEAIDSLKPGSKIYHSVTKTEARSKGNREGYEATNIEVFLPESDTGELTQPVAGPIPSTVMSAALQAALEDRC